MERFTNNAQTTLSAAITDAGATTCTVTSAAAFPSSGTFRIRIDDEILIVRAVSGSTFQSLLRGQEGTTASTHSNGASVALILTAVSAAIGALSYLTGCNIVPPPQTGWTWDNQGTASNGFTGGGGLWLWAPSASTGPHVLYRTAPTPPYKITIAFRILGTNTNYSLMGFVFRESSSGKLDINGPGYDQSASGFQSAKWTNSTTWSANRSVWTPGTVCESGLWVMRFQDDNSNRICEWTIDGVNFSPHQTVGRTDFLTADQVGICVYNNGTTYYHGLHLLSWEEA